MAPTAPRPYPRTILRAAFTSDSEEPVRFLPGAILSNRYRVLGLVGRGGMGEVYRADDLKLGQAVALKFLSQRFEHDPSRFQRFLNEVKLARQIAHPNVCRVYDVGDVDGQHYLSMEYIDGEDLASLLRRIGRLPRDTATQIARQICLGLAAAHAQGILHRDLKPANVMIDGRGRVRITDFGLAALADELDSSETLAGTPAYMAPEQLSGIEVTIKSELYALGLVLYEMFTGRRPFEGATPTAVARMKRDSTPTSPSAHVKGLDPAIERVILRCLEYDPRARPSSAGAVANALPGADPLQEAIALGETPSPDLVAEGAAPLGLHAVHVWASLAAFLVVLALVAVVGTRTRFLSTVSLDKPQGYLIERAREVVRMFGHPDPEVHEAYGYEPDWESLDPASGQGDLVFWYRQSRRPLVPARHIVTQDDPPARDAGAAWVRLDTQGHLRSFELLPGSEGGLQPVAVDSTWDALFRQAGLDRSEFETTVPERYPPGYADARASWVAALPGTPGVPIRVEAAALEGRPVFFRASGPRVAESRGEEGDVWAKINTAASLVLFAPVLIAAVFLARRNLRWGRGDRKGAFRLSVFMFVLWLMLGMLRTGHFLDVVELEILFGVLSRACLSFGLAWVLYMAFEPYARRTWPVTLVSWVRILDGRFRDPLVGWHLLVGAVVGCVAALLAHANVLAMGLLDFVTWGPGAIAFQLRPLVSFRHALGGVLSLLGFAVTTSLQTGVILLVLRVILRRQVPAVIGLYLVMLLVFAGAPATLPGHALILALFLAVLFRLGLLAMMSGLFVFVLLGNYLITLNPASPFSPASYLAVSVAGCIAVYGFHFSLTRGVIHRSAPLDAPVS